jgi:Na+-transporting NADH:ubiquinone oxidoreductase subunit NqrC
MDSTMLGTIVLALLPGILVAVLAYVLIEKFLNNENLRRKIEVQKIATTQITPQRLAAYERMALFLERIKPTALARRISAQSTAKNYEVLLIQTIQSEWEHNLSQQIYINPETWKIIYSAKNATQNFIRECVMDVGPEATAQELQEQIIQKSISDNIPSNGALLKLQVDIQGNL